MRKHDKNKKKKDNILTTNEISTVENNFAKSEIPLHLIFRSDIRLSKETKKSLVVALSAHFVKIFSLDKSGKKCKIFAQFHISQVVEITYSENEHTVIKTNKGSYGIIDQNNTLKFAQLLYRNVVLSYYKLNNVNYNYITANSSDRSNFPLIELDVSPSQKFQFCYSALCSLYSAPYHHEVVSYIHNQIIHNNPILNFTNIPIGVFSFDSSTKTIEKAFLEAIQLTSFFLGVYCENIKCSDLLKYFTSFFTEESGLKLVHIVNCHLNGNFKDLLKQIETISSSPVFYWNLNNNKKLDFKEFPRIIELTSEKLIFLGISDCEIKKNVAAAIFSALSDNPNAWYLEQLEIGNVSLIDESFLEFERFLKTINRKNSNKIFSLDISNNDNFECVLHLISNELPNLEKLNLSRNRFSHDSITKLRNYIKSSSKLNNLDLSNSIIQPDEIADIIEAFSSNSELSGITLCLNSLSLYSTQLLPIFRAFISGDTNSDKKWKSIFLESNELNKEDLLNLIALLKLFPNLEALSFSYNFDSSMNNISEELCCIKQLNSLKRLSIKGNSNKNLGMNIIPLLREINHFDAIDISGSNIGKVGLDAVFQLISGRIQRISLDNNNIDSIESLMSLLSAVKQNQNLISLKFPINDSFNYCINANKNKAALIQKIGEIQNDINQIIYQRRKIAISNDSINNSIFLLQLPFENEFENVNDNLGSLPKFVHNLRCQFHKAFKNDNRTVHTCVCDIFNIPIPFQKKDETWKELKNPERINIGEMFIYETDSMKYIIKENIEIDRLDENNLSDSKQIAMENYDYAKATKPETPIKTVKRSNDDYAQLERTAVKNRELKKSKIKSSRKTNDKYDYDYDSSSDYDKMIPSQKKKIYHSSSDDYSNKNYYHQKDKKKKQILKSSDEEIHHKRYVDTYDVSDSDSYEMKTKRKVSGYSSDYSDTRHRKNKSRRISLSESSSSNDEIWSHRKNINGKSFKKGKARLNHFDDLTSDSSDDSDQERIKRHRINGKQSNNIYNKSDYSPKKASPFKRKPENQRRFDDYSDSDEEILYYRNQSPQKRRQMIKQPAPPLELDNKSHKKKSPYDFDVFKNQASRKRKIERNPMLDGTPLDTYFGESKVPYDDF